MRAHAVELHRRLSSLENALIEQDENGANDLLKLVLMNPDPEATYQSELAGCVFVGHLATDMDSIGSALGAAELFGGVASRASDVNAETAFALDYFGIAPPPPFEDVCGQRHVCLVDHCQSSQMHPAVNPALIRGIIDHHALQSSTVCTDVPIYVDIRPWGSACSIIAHTFVTMRRRISKPTASLLLCGILSDTLNLRSPTTTVHDRRMVTMLCKAVQLADPNDLAKALFKAKSKNLALLSAHQLIRGDQKTFEFKRSDGSKLSIGFGVVETTDIDAMLARRTELLLECRALKKEESLDMVFLALVDIANLHSLLLICGPKEASLAEATYGGKVDAGTNLLDLGSRVSRKKNFIPPLSEVIQEGWAVPTDLAALPDPSEDFGRVVMVCTPTGCMTKRAPSLRASAHAISAALWLDKQAHAHGEGAHACSHEHA